MESKELEDVGFMNLAMEEAQKALLHDDIPVGAVVVLDGKIIGTGKNERELIPSPIAHAEIQALSEAAKNHRHWNLSGAKLYVTLEPCVMCAGAIVMARVDEVIYAATDPKGGAISLKIPILQNDDLNHKVKFREGPLGNEAGEMIRQFFRRKRKEKNTSGTKE